MPIYRVSVQRTMEGRPGEIFVEAIDVADARSIAASRHYNPTSFDLVTDASSFDPDKVIRRPIKELARPEAQGTPVWNIAWGVFFGLLMFYFFASFLSCAASF